MSNVRVTDGKFLLIKNVEALYPRIDRTYRFDNAANQSVPCTPQHEGARYDIRFKMDESTAKELLTAMLPAYEEARKEDWPKKMEFPFSIEEQDDGKKIYLYRSGRKGSYGGDVVPPPRVFDCANVRISDPKFRLTTGSVINLAATMVPYRMKTGHDWGVSLRLSAVQVITLAPESLTSPFDVVERSDGYKTEAAPFEEGKSTPTADTTETTETATQSVDAMFDDDKPENKAENKTDAANDGWENLGPENESPNKLEENLAKVLDDWK